MDPLTDLQAQVIALRNAIESLWLSMLHPDPERVAHAQRMHQSSVAALHRLQPENDTARAMLDQVILHTDRLWHSIEQQTAVVTPAYPRNA